MGVIIMYKLEVNYLESIEQENGGILEDVA